MSDFRIQIANSERVVILGRPGSGKTVLARILFGSYKTAVAIDPKHRLELPGFTTIASVEEFRNTWPQRARRVIFRPAVDDVAAAWAEVDEVLGRVFRYGRTAVLVDETVDVASATRIVPGYRRVLRLGREPLIPTFSLSQRAIGLHNDVFAMSEHLIVMDLPLEVDRRKAAGIGGDELLTSADDHFGRPFGFAYRGPASRGRVVWCPPLELPAAQPPRQPTTEAPPTTTGDRSV